MGVTGRIRSLGESDGSGGLSGGALSARIGETLSEAFRAEGLVIDNPAIEDGISSMVEALYANQAAEAPDVLVLVVRSPSVNAAALPGQLIVVFSGLVEELESSDQCAAVLAHELGHIARGDPTRQILREMGLGVLAMATGARQGAVLVQSLMREAVSLSYSRKYEERADNYALDILESAGLDPASFARALQIISSNQGPQGGVGARYLDPHPDIDLRIENAFDRSSVAEYQSIDVDWGQFQQAVRTH